MKLENKNWDILDHDKCGVYAFVLEHFEENRHTSVEERFIKERMSIMAVFFVNLCVNIDQCHSEGSL